jgi:hypothetical protein
LSKPVEEEEVAENKATFLDAPKGLEAPRKYEYMCQFDTEKSITVICMEIENELYRLRIQRGKAAK